MINVEITEHSLVVKIWSTLIYTGPFYFNYIVLTPKLSEHISILKYLKWGFFYVVFNFVWFGGFWELGSVEVLGLVDASSNLGGTVHLLFYFFAISTIGRLTVESMKNSTAVHGLYLAQKSHEIHELRTNMSFPFIEKVLGNLEEESKIEPRNIVKPVSLLAKFLRFKLYRKKEELILLSDEIEAIDCYIKLHQFSDLEKSLISFEKDDWIEKGTAFELVEGYLNSTENSSANDLQIVWKGEGIQLNLFPKVI